MRAVRLWIVTFLFVAVGFAAPAPQKTDSLPRAKVNTLLDEIARRLWDKHAHIEMAKPYFELPFSDLAKKRLRYVVKGKLKNTPWKEKGTADVSSSLTVRLTSPPKSLSIEAISTHRVETDVLAAIRHGAALAMKEDLPKASFKAAVDELLKKVTKVDSLTDLFALLQQAQNLSISYLSDDLVTSEKRHRDLKQDPTAMEIDVIFEERRIKEIKAQLEAFKQIDLECDRNDQGKVAEIRIKHPDPADFLIAHVDQIVARSAVLRLTERQIIFDHTSSHPVTSEKLKKLTDDLKRIFDGLDKDNREEKEEVEAVFKSALERFTKVITGAD